MAKMMMGQIDHARNRVRELKLEKYGARPTKPKIKGSGDVLEAIRDEFLVIKPAQLRNAFYNYVDRIVDNVVTSETNGYGDNRVTTYSINEQAPSSVQDALATIVYKKENTAEMKRWTEESTLYDLRQEAINLVATEVEDAIVLGDQHAALIALKEFAAYEY